MFGLLSSFRKGILTMLLIMPMIIVTVPEAHAATTPSLGAAATYGVLADTYTNTSVGTTVNGDVGFTTGPAVVPAGTRTNYGSGAPYATAGTDQGSALTALAAQPCTFTFDPGAIDLSTDTTHGTAGIYAPGVYCSTGAMDVGGPLTLDGNGTFIFRAVGALTSTAGATVTLSDVSACNVFWTPTQATTLAANTTFAGTVIDNAGITVGANTIWTGRALAFGGTVTTDTDTISVPACTSSVPPSAESSDMLPRPIISATKIPSPLALPGAGSVTYTYEVSNPGLYTMHNISLVDDKCSTVDYVSGDANADTFLQTNEVWTYTCTTFLTQDTFNAAKATGFANGFPATDIAYATVRVGTELPAPLIHVIKTPDRFLLPFGGGRVSYAYEVRNPGVVALHNVRVTDNKCGPVNYVSGDIDDNDLLDTDETWKYSCQSNIGLTTINTVTATGTANEQTATDIALATVTVASRPVTFVSPPILNPAAPPEPQVVPVTAPLLPNTGIGPEASALPWEVIAIGLTIGVSLLAFPLRKRFFSQN